MMNLLLVVAHSLVCLLLIALVLMQQGKGADSAFGAGASSTVFGSKGSNSFIVKATALIAFVFFVTTTSLTYLTQYQSKNQSVVNTLTTQSNKITHKPSTHTQQGQQTQHAKPLKKSSK